MARYQFPYMVHIAEDIPQSLPIRIIFLKWRQKYVNEGWWDMRHNTWNKVHAYLQAGSDPQGGPDFNWGLAFIWSPRDESEGGARETALALSTTFAFEMEKMWN